MKTPPAAFEMTQNLRHQKQYLNTDNNMRLDNSPFYSSNTTHSSTQRQTWFLDTSTSIAAPANTKTETAAYFLVSNTPSTGFDLLAFIWLFRDT